MPLVLTLSTWAMGFVCLGLVYLILSRYFPMAKRKTLGIPGPDPLLLLGNLKLIGDIMNKNGALLYNVFEVLRDRYGGRYSLFFGPRLFIITEELEDIREILVKKFDHFSDRQEMNFLSDSLREAIVNQKGQIWRHSRAKLSPAFTTAKIRAMSASVHRNSEIFLELLHDDALNNNYFDIYDLYKRLTLSVIADCAFGFEADCLRNSDCPFAFHAANYFRQMPSPENSALMGISVVIPEVAPICEWLHCRLSDAGKSEAWMSEALRRVIEGRIRGMETDRNDVISLLINSNLPTNEIVNNAFAFLLAGYETTSTALAFATWLLGKNENIQEKLANELKTLPDHQKTNDYYDQVMTLPYLNAVYKEALRLYPPITFFVNRTCVAECEVGGVRYEKGTQVGIPIWNVHRNAEFWPEPDEFRPERFLSGKPQTPFTWLPFGAGPRGCVGQRFAEMEFKIVLARTLSRFQIVLSPEIQDRLELSNPTAMLSTPKISILIKSRDS